MDDSYSENMKPQAQEPFEEALSMNSPDLNAEIFQEPQIDTHLQLDSFEDQFLLQNNVPLNTLTKDTTQSSHSHSDSSLVEPFLNLGLNSPLHSYGSQQMGPNPTIVDETTFPEASNSAQIMRESILYENEDRKIKLDRFLQKKPLRNYGTILRYPSRQKAAYQRLRVDGMFMKDESLQKKQTAKFEMTSEITPKKPAKKIGKFETLALLKTTTSLKGKR